MLVGPDQRDVALVKRPRRGVGAMEHGEIDPAACGRARERARVGWARAEAQEMREAYPAMYA